jgi:16S rRNA (cytidine1402-2'-O)-methyltransferase
VSDQTVGHLVVCPTPIGNLQDVTLRVLDALRSVDLVACEDTRRTRKLLDRHEVGAKLISYHEHNERKRAAELVSAMREGKIVALVSDSGTPLVSDPGYALVRACVAAGLEVEVLPGPSAALTALVASGLPADRWRFAGFLPRKRGELRRVLEEPGGSLVAFESPRRVPATLAVLAEIDSDRPVAVCRELTKAHEEVVRGTASSLAERYAGTPPRGEVVIVIGPAPAEDGDPSSGPGPGAVARLVESGARPREAAAVVAELTGSRPNAVYRAWAQRERRGDAERGHGGTTAGHPGVTDSDD